MKEMKDNKKEVNGPNMAPASKKNKNLIDLETIEFQIRESYKAARTNIVYSIIKKGCKKISFTSVSKSEGKTITSVNIAIALAKQVNIKVLIIDCDLRRPQVHNLLSIEPAPGVTNFLNGECDKEAIIKPTKVENLFAVPCGAIPPNPSELLESSDMHDFIKNAEKEYDFIIFDTPPIGVVVDALPIVKQTDGVVLIVKHNHTTYPGLKRIVETLSRNNAKILGIVVNGVDTLKTDKGGKLFGGNGYGYGYGYGYYS